MPWCTTYHSLPRGITILDDPARNEIFTMPVRKVYLTLRILTPLVLGLALVVSWIILNIGQHPWLDFNVGTIVWRPVFRITS